MKTTNEQDLSLRVIALLLSLLTLLPLAACGQKNPVATTAPAQTGRAF